MIHTFNNKGFSLIPCVQRIIMKWKIWFGWIFTKSWQYDRTGKLDCKFYEQFFFGKSLRIHTCKVWLFVNIFNKDSKRFKKTWRFSLNTASEIGFWSVIFSQLTIWQSNRMFFSMQLCKVATQCLVDCLSTDYTK